jgi:hypothetical protein
MTTARSAGRLEVHVQEWLNAQIANGFAAFEGASITGSIPVKESLINEMIASFLAHAGEPASAPAFDPRLVTPFIRAATVRAEPGVVTLHLDLRVGPRT